MVEATSVSLDPWVIRLNKTYKELRQIYDGPFSSNECIMTIREDDEGDFYYYTIVNVGYDTGHDTFQVTDSVSRTFTCDGEDEYPECTMPSEQP